VTPEAVLTQARPRMIRLASRFVADAETVVEDAARRFEAMRAQMGYADRPEHPLAHALFVSSVNLALFLALRARGVDVNDFGRALLTGLARAPLPAPPPLDDATRQRQLETFLDAARESVEFPRPGEDVFEWVAGDGTALDYGYDVTSCAACSAASRHDAMEFVPYLCAVDDVMSDKFGLGLRRTGSIALGAPRCDFRYRAGGEPLRLAEQYPERIPYICVD
jgi:hypothetical protein